MDNFYAAFAGNDYYPTGGWFDLVGIFDTEETAVAMAKAGNLDWWHVVNLETSEIVDSGNVR